MTSPRLDGRVVAVTGVDGFVGRHVARLASHAGAEVVGVSRTAEADAALASHLSAYRSADLRREWPEGLKPDVVIHLAGRSAVGPSFGSPQAYLDDNSAMVTTMCEALIGSDAATRIVGVSTGAVYAPPADGAGPTDESAPLRSSSPYVVSKLLVEHQLDYYALRGLSTVVARPLNHIGPGQGPGFLLPDLVARLRALEDGQPLIVGDLDTERDYSDVRDVAAAYLALAAAPTLEHRVYNVASGVSTSGRRLLELVCEKLGRAAPELLVDEALIRPADPRRIVGSAARLRAEAGWEPVFTLAESVGDMITAS